MASPELMYFAEYTDGCLFACFVIRCSEIAWIRIIPLRCRDPCVTGVSIFVLAFGRPDVAVCGVLQQLHAAVDSRYRVSTQTRDHE